MSKMIGIKIADKDSEFAYIYASSRKELEKAEKLLKTQMVDIGAPILYKDFPAILVRKSS